MGNRGSPKNTQSIENRLSKIVEELIEIRKQEGKLRVEFKKLGIKRKELIEERKKLFNRLNLCLTYTIYIFNFF